jgi:hypothetical protein
MSEQEFDINDPNLQLDLPDNYDPEAEAGGGFPPPPNDGVNRIALFLAEDTENKEAVRFSKGKVVATFRARFVKEDGELGSYLKDYYPTSQVFDGQATSALANLARLANNPVRTNQPGEYIKHIKGIFSTEEPFYVQAKTQWIKSTPTLDPETGEHVVGADGYKAYTEVKGQSKIQQAAIQSAQMRAMTEGLDEEGTNTLINYAAKNPHLYIDPVSGDEKSVRAEVRYIVGK